MIFFSLQHCVGCITGVLFKCFRLLFLKALGITSLIECEADSVSYYLCDLQQSLSLSVLQLFNL